MIQARRSLKLSVLIPELLLDVKLFLTFLLVQFIRHLKQENDAIVKHFVSLGI